MSRPVRMTSTSVILVRKDLDSALEALNVFGQFHIEEAGSNEQPFEYDRSVQKMEENLADINTLKEELTPEKSSFNDMFRYRRVVKTRVTSENWHSLFEQVSMDVEALNKEANGAIAKLKILQQKASELEHVQNMLQALEAIGTDIPAIEESQLITVRVASVPRKVVPELGKSLEEFPLIFHSCYLTKETSFVCMAFPSKHKSDIERILKNHQAEPFELPEYLPHDSSQALLEIYKNIKEHGKKSKNATSDLHALGKNNANKLALLEETANNILALLHAKRMVKQEKHLAVIKGFVPKSQLRRLTETVNTKLGGKALVFENNFAPVADPPTLIRNSRFVKPFEEITKLYGLPHYDELDPTPIVAITFPLIFGLMFGDLGHGLVLLLGGLALGFLVKNHDGIRNMCWILSACGIGAMIAGLLFGELFGMRVFPPLWFDPFTNVLSFLVFSLFVGVAQIMSGLILELVDHALRKEAIDVLFTSLPKIAFYTGSVYMVAAYGLNFDAWFSGPVLLTIVPFLFLILGKPIIQEVSRRASHGLGALDQNTSWGQRIIEGGDLVSRLLSNTMSYTRILALLMAHWALTMVTYVVAGLLNTSTVGALLGGIVIVIGNLFVMALEGLVVFIHTLRLHFYEWFSKFYQGTGTPFSPFRQSFEYSEVVIGKRLTED